jgi:hypothetical protein
VPKLYLFAPTTSSLLDFLSLHLRAFLYSFLYICVGHPALEEPVVWETGTIQHSPVHPLDLLQDAATFSTRAAVFDERVHQSRLTFDARLPCYISPVVCV